MDTTEFIIKMLKNKRDGYYVELGSAVPIHGNNTYVLETDYNWQGISIDMNERLCSEFNSVRKNKAICTNALTYDYRKHFEENDFPQQIDYLQVDIDAGYDIGARSLGNPAQSLHGLIAMPLNTYRFSVIMFEHDALLNYRYGSIRDASREILDSLGYTLVVRKTWEDWWVDPNVIPYLEFRESFRMDAP